jgi:hypothetical protein
VEVVGGEGLAVGLVGRLMACQESMVGVMASMVMGVLGREK